MRTESLSLADAVRYHMSTPSNPFEIAALLTLPERMSAAELRRLVQERVLSHERFRQTVAEARFPRRPRWREEAAFELSAHAVCHPEPALADALLAERISDRLSQRLAFDRSPWCMELFPLASGGSALLFRVHHCVADGLSLVRLLCELADEPRPSPPRASPIARDRARSSPSVARRVSDGARAVWSTVRELAVTRPDQTRELHRPSGRKAVAWSGPLDLAALSGAAEQRGRHMTELLLSAAADALARALSEGGRDVPSRVRALVPFGATLGKRELGNHFASAFVDLVLDEPDPWRRMERIAEHAEKLQDPTHARAARTLIGLAGWLSPTLMRSAIDFFSRRASLVLSNVPGPSEAVRLMGHEVQSIIVFAPPSNSIGLSLTVFGYAGELRASVEVDLALPLAPGPLIADFESSLRALSQPLRKA